MKWILKNSEDDMITLKQNDDLFNLKRCCAKYLALAPIFECLNVNNIPYANIKGETLSLYAFDQYGQRSYGDIDILVSRKNLHVLEAVLTQNGYISPSVTREEKVMMISASHQTAAWYKITNQKFKSVIDVNFDIFWGEHMGRHIDIDQFLSDTIEMKIYGVKVRVLSPLKAMIQLILHHYKEMNSIYHIAEHDCIKESMFRDVYYLWKNNSDAISLEKLYELSLEYEIIPYVFYILYFTNKIFDDQKLSRYVEAFHTQDGFDLLDYYGLAVRERKLWKVDFQTRLKTNKMYDLIKADLTEDDLIKLERNRKIFG